METGKYWWTKGNNHERLLCTSKLQNTGGLVEVIKKWMADYPK